MTQAVHRFLPWVLAGALAFAVAIEEVRLFRARAAIRDLADVLEVLRRDPKAARYERLWKQAELGHQESLKMHDTYLSAMQQARAERDAAIAELAKLRGGR